MNEQEPGHRKWHDDTPFPKRWKGYTALKIALLIVALMLALYLLGLF